MKKKICLIIISIILLIPVKTSAKTLGEYKAELDALEQSYLDNQSSIQRTDDEINAANARIDEIYGEIDTIEAEMVEINKDIAKLNEQIIKKSNEIRDLMRYYQFSNGESTYLEYLFSADSITDFIYRLSITEQLSKYNDKLINDMHELVKQNNENIANLRTYETSLKDLQQELNAQLVILGNQRRELGEESLTIQEEIDAQRLIVKQYEDLGCKDDQEVTTCGKEALPLGTKFYRPIEVGYVTDEYGIRVDPITGISGSFHSGIDMSTYRSCDSCMMIHSVATGVVGTASYSSSMGNYVVIWHNINGESYSSMYMHLSEIYVSPGQEVTKDTVIGHMGNTGWSTATHLHLTMLTCHLWKPGADCYYPSDTAEPRSYINFPSSMYTDWEDRTNYYN